MFLPDRLCDRWPKLWDQVWDRLTKDESLFDTKSHKLRDGLTKDQARAILLMAAQTAIECGFRLILSDDESDLMARKFDRVKFDVKSKPTR